MKKLLISSIILLVICACDDHKTTINKTCTIKYDTYIKGHHFYAIDSDNKDGSLVHDPECSKCQEESDKKSRKTFEISIEIGDNLKSLLNN